MRIVRSLVLCSCWLLGTLFLKTKAEPNVANLIIIYDENEGIVPDNKFISMAMRDAFQSQTAPILLPGNLALRAATFLQTPTAESLNLPGVKQKEFEDYIREMDVKLKTIEQARAVKSDISNNEACALKDSLKTMYDKIVTTLHDSSKNSPYRLNIGIAISSREMAKQIHNLIRRTSCGNISGKNSVEEYAEPYFIGINLSDWRIFSVTMPDKQLTSQRMILFVPTKYAQTHNALDGDTINLGKLSFNEEALKQINTTDLTKEVFGYDFPTGKVALSIKQIFDFKKQTPIRWNIYITGHGGSPDYDPTPITMLLSNKSIQPSFIAGMPHNEFLTLMNMWTMLPVNIVVYGTCFGGTSPNINAITELFLLTTNIARYGSEGFNLPTVISIATSGVTAAIDSNFTIFFNDLQEIFTGPEKSIEQQKILLGEACRNVSKDFPLVLFSPKQKVREAMFAASKKIFEQSQQALQSAVSQKVSQDRDTLEKKLNEAFTLEGTTLADWAHERAEARLCKGVKPGALAAEITQVMQDAGAHTELEQKSANTGISLSVLVRALAKKRLCNRMIKPDDLAREIELIIKERIEEEAARELSASKQLTITTSEETTHSTVSGEKKPEFEPLRGFSPKDALKMFGYFQTPMIKKVIDLLLAINLLDEQSRNDSNLVDLIEFMGKSGLSNEIVQNFIKDSIYDISSWPQTYQWGHIYRMLRFVIERKMSETLIEEILKLPQMQEMPSNLIINLIKMVQPLNSDTLNRLLFEQPALLKYGIPFGLEFLVSDDKQKNLELIKQLAILIDKLAAMTKDKPESETETFLKQIVAAVDRLGISRDVVKNILKLLPVSEAGQ